MRRELFKIVAPAKAGAAGDRALPPAAGDPGLRRDDGDPS